MSEQTDKIVDAVKGIGAAVDSKEGAVDAGITRLQGWLESLKGLHHTAWVLLIAGIALCIFGGWIWFN